MVELGSHAELMQQGGRYKTMFDLQASRFYEESLVDEKNNRRGGHFDVLH